MVRRCRLQGMHRKANLIGPNVAKYRYERGWTQEELASKLQLLGCHMTREMLANIETQHRGISDEQVDYFADVFGMSRDQLFPPRRRKGAK